MIQTADDALSVIELAESEEDILNEVRALFRDNAIFGPIVISQLSMNVNKSHLAFSMDSGVVGVVDLSTKSVSRMKTKHESVGVYQVLPVYMMTISLLIGLWFC